MSDEIKVISVDSVDTSTPEDKKKALKSKSLIITGSTIAAVIAMSIAMMYTGDGEKTERKLTSAPKELEFGTNSDRNLWQDKTQQDMRQMREMFEELVAKNTELNKKLDKASERDQLFEKALRDSQKKNVSLQETLQNLKSETDDKIQQAVEDAKSYKTQPIVSIPEGAKIKIPPPKPSNSGPVTPFKKPDALVDPEGKEIPAPPMNPFAVIKKKTVAKPVPSFKQPNTGMVNNEDKSFTEEEDTDGLLITGMSQDQVKKYKKERVKAERKLVKSDFAGYLPEGSFAEVAIISGLDSGASADSKESPMPVMMRIQSDAVVPSMQGRLKYKLKGCFAIGSAYGDVSSERVMISPTRISCVDASRKYVLSAKISGIITDFDSSNGLRGKVEYRDGAKLAQSVLASTVSSFAQLASVGGGVSSSTLSSAIQYDDSGNINLPSMGQIGSSVGLNSLSSAAEVIAKRYADRASEIHPIIYLPAGRKGTLYLNKGVKLKWSSYDSIYQEEITPKEESATSGGILEGL